MEVVTEAFDIPMDIMTKLATGEYRRLGGVVRVAIGPNKGQIVKHLDPIKIEQVAQNKNVVTKVIEFSKKNRKVIIIGTAVAGTMVAGNFVHQKIKNRVLTAKSLDTLTNVNRKIFIDAMIDEKTEYDFKTDIINYQKVFDW